MAGWVFLIAVVCGAFALICTAPYIALIFAIVKGTLAALAGAM